MAETTQSTTDTAGLKKVWGDAVANIQHRFEAVEKIWNDTFTQVNTRLHDVNDDVREFVKKVEEDGRKRIDTIRGQLKVDDVVGRIRTTDLFEQGARLTNETIERLGLATREEVEGLSKKLETVRKRASSSAKTKEVKDLEKRVAALEKALGTKGGSAKKSTASKSTAKKSTAKKSTAKK
ncbi:MAG: hypothetical protein ACQEXJ_01675 [Myxococcota bacterium]